MEFKRIVVLANSYKKHPGRCIAGREIAEDNNLGDWIRPISNQPEGELLPQHMRASDGKPVEILDVVGVPVVRHSNDKVHPEDWLIDTSQRWNRYPTFNSRNLASMEEKPHNLWMDPQSRPDRTTTEFLIKQSNHQSLHLIRPANFRIELTNDFNPFEGRNQKKRRACFEYQGQSHSLGLTDPVFTGQYASSFPSPDEPTNIIRPPFKDNCLLCVSLTPVFNGYHYKIVATVLELP